MKKLLTLLTLCAFLSAPAFAQYKYFVGGELGFNSSKSTNGFAFKPNVGYMLNDRMILVGSLGYNSNTIKGSGAIKDIKTSGFGVGLELRYGWKAGDNAFVFLAPGVHYNNDEDAADEHTTTLGLGIRPGITYQLAPRWSITSHFGNLGLSSKKVGDGDSVSNFGLNLNMNSIGFLISYHF